jgi:beta-phosphoglucomutase-like phosphatase (HAD superfamily)
MTETTILSLDPRIVPPPPFEALIFDCDGTLADTMPIHFVAWVDILRRHGGDMSEELFYQSAGRPTRSIIEHLNQEFGYNLDVDAIYHEKEKAYLNLIDTIHEVKAVADIARAYYGKVPLAVASGGEHLIVDRTLAAIGLTNLFDAVIGADDVVHGKPAPDMFLLAAERIGVDPANCIVYEDGEPGIVAAHSAGMRVVDVRVLFEQTRTS